MFSTQLITLNYLLYSPTDAAPQFLEKITPFIRFKSSRGRRNAGLVALIGLLVLTKILINCTLVFIVLYL